MYFSADTPDKPRNVKAIPISSTEVNVTWSLAVTQGGFDVMAYGIDFHEVHGNYFFLIIINKSTSKDLPKLLGGEIAAPRFSDGPLS